MRVNLDIEDDLEFEMIKKKIMDRLEHHRSHVVVCSDCNQIDLALAILFSDELTITNTEKTIQKIKEFVD